jgi:hypothetical protein
MGWAACCASYCEAAEIPPALGSGAQPLDVVRCRLIAPICTFSGSDSKVEALSIEQAEALYLQCADQSLDASVLLICYAPWCSHCKLMEEEVSASAAAAAAPSPFSPRTPPPTPRLHPTPPAQIETLAQALAQQQGARVLKLRSDLASTRYFAKQVLQVQTYPSILFFPRQSQMFYKYQHSLRSAEALLSFVNTISASHGGPRWSLEPRAGAEQRQRQQRQQTASAAAVAAGPSTEAATAPAQQLVAASTSTEAATVPAQQLVAASTSTEAATEAAAVPAAAAQASATQHIAAVAVAPPAPRWLPAPGATTALALAAGLAAAAAAAAAARRGAAGGAAVAGGVAASQPAGDIDRSIGSVASLLWQLLKLRLSMCARPLAAAASAGAQQAGEAPQRPATPSHQLTLEEDPVEALAAELLDSLPDKARSPAGGGSGGDNSPGARRLRMQVAGALVDSAPAPASLDYGRREGERSRDARDVRDAREAREAAREARDAKEARDAREGRSPGGGRGLQLHPHTAGRSSSQRVRALLDTQEDEEFYLSSGALGEHHHRCGAAAPGGRGGGGGGAALPAVLRGLWGGPSIEAGSCFAQLVPWPCAGLARRRMAAWTAATLRARRRRARAPPTPPTLPTPPPPPPAHRPPTGRTGRTGQRRRTPAAAAAQQGASGGPGHPRWSCPAAAPVIKRPAARAAAPQWWCRSCFTRSRCRRSRWRRRRRC